jgi:cellobiose phosphorylase
MVAEGEVNGEVSYETDRMRFIGRGKTVADPQAHSGPLSGSEGSVLDPIVAVRHRMTLDPAETVRINIVSGVAETRSSVWNWWISTGIPILRIEHSSGMDTQPGVVAANQYHRQGPIVWALAGSVIYANASLRANPGILLQNRRNQSGLWGTISGDLPIVLCVCRSDTHRTGASLVLAHGYWRLKGSCRSGDLERGWRRVIGSLERPIMG